MGEQGTVWGFLCGQTSPEEQAEAQQCLLYTCLSVIPCHDIAWCHMGTERHMSRETVDGMAPSRATLMAHYHSHCHMWPEGSALSPAAQAGPATVDVLTSLP